MPAYDLVPFVVGFRAPNAQPGTTVSFNWLGKDVTLTGSEWGGRRDCGLRDILQFSRAGDPPRDWSVIEIADYANYSDLAGRRPARYALQFAPATPLPTVIEALWVWANGAKPETRTSKVTVDKPGRVVWMAQAERWVGWYWELLEAEMNAAETRIKIGAMEAHDGPA